MKEVKRRPFYPASKSPLPIKVSKSLPEKPIINENIIPKLDFHDTFLNLSCHGPINTNYKIERYTSMETRVVETLQDYNIQYPCDVYILPSSQHQTYFHIQNPELNTGSIIKNASESAIEESLKTEILIKLKAEKIQNFRSNLLKRLAKEEKQNKKQSHEIIKCKSSIY